MGTRNLLWIGSAMLLCSTVAWFLDQNIRVGIAEYNRIIENRIQRLEERYDLDIREIKNDIKAILNSIKK